MTPPRPAARVAIITATRLLDNRLPYLEQLHQSLDNQTVPLEWILALDGADPARLPEALAADPRVRVLPLPRPVGAATARNLALNLVTEADYVKYCDDDDVLPEGALEIPYRHAVDSGLGWVASWSADWFPAQDTTRIWKCPTPPGRHEAGDVWTYWRTPEDQIPIGPTTLLSRTSLLKAAGGMGGLVQGEDYLMIMGVTSLSAGELLPVVTYLYRKHEEQMTKSAQFMAFEDQVRRYAWNFGKELRLAVAGRAPAPPRRVAAHGSRALA